MREYAQRCATMRIFIVEDLPDPDGLGGAPRTRSISQIVLLGAASMAITALIGKIAGTAV
jgi:hypothetical protein